VLNLLRRSRLHAWLRARKRAESGSRRSTHATEHASRPPIAPLLLRVLGVVALIAVASLSAWGALRLGQLLLQLHVADWSAIAHAGSYTLLRTTAAVALGSLWTIPAGIYIGTHPRVSRVLQPLVQVAASFPAPMVFPLALFVLGRFGISLSFGAVVLMILGTQWYILFNVIAGAMSIPNELREATDVYRLSRWQRWRRLLLPGVFPALVTGWVTAAGGAWNASIVSEYVHVGGSVRRANGLGALISTAAESGRFPVLAASVIAMAALVVLINRTFWKRLYRLAESRYALSR
jgi:NitT/TauT family transport system permease protein